MTTYKYAAILCPTVEGFKPEDILRVSWRNTRVSIRDNDGRNICEDRLKEHLSHQRFEVSRDEKVPK